MRIIIGILAVIIIIQAFIMWKYQRQIKNICRQLSFLMEHDSNKLIQREIDMGGIGELSDKLNELLDLRKKERNEYRKKEELIADTYTNLSHDIRTPLTSLEELFTFTKLKNDSYKLELTDCCMNRILKEAVFSYYDE